MKRFVAGFALVVLMSLTCGLSAQEKTSEYYPLKVGNKWTYKVTGSDITMKVAAFEKVGETMCAKIETIINDKAVAYEHIAVAEDGIYRHSLNGVKPDKPVRFLKLPVKKDDSWDIDAKIGSQTIKGKFVTKEEKVKVLNKEYDTVIADGKDFDINGKQSSIKYWFAKDVGIVKLQFSMDGQDTILELENYEAAK